MYFKLRKWKLDDAADVALYANNVKIAENLRNAFPNPYTLQDAQDFVDDCISGDESTQLCRAIVVEEIVVGSIALCLGGDVYCKSAELGYWLAQEHWGSGIMSAAIKRICAEGFAWFDIARIFAEPFARNIGSRRVLEKAGFTLDCVLKNSVFKNGELCDSCIYSLSCPENKREGILNE